ncbi:hypothetical protein NDU88_001308 [Pleurodeles waltl]|uniref:Uncharacterized protein n=1 Tax=Pleurodeles waltl TaxID=8319 RepID=A0AAV7TI72_PLEWA|nr:hypothetical protein NDU88_001308 [Pleurodeles waltl]
MKGAMVHLSFDERVSELVSATANTYVPTRRPGGRFVPHLSKGKGAAKAFPTQRLPRRHRCQVQRGTGVEAEKIPSSQRLDSDAIFTYP